MLARSRLGPAPLLALLLLAPRAANAAWSLNGNLVCTAANDQTNTVMAPDGSGGMFIAWQDDRTGTSDLYAMRLTASGSAAPGWPANGFAVCTATGDQKLAVIAADGAGGFYLAWEDYRVPGGESDVYLQRVTGSATLAAGWPSNGLAVCALAGSQGYPSLIADASGAIVAWEDDRSSVSLSDIYVQRVSGGGVPQWTMNGVALCTAAGNQLFPTMASDGAGGAIVTWQDARGGNPDVYAQRVNAAGAPQWAADGVVVCDALYEQFTPRLVPDASGGVIIEWDDDRDLNGDIYAQRLNGAGVRQWAQNGIPICTDLNEQYSACVVVDGMGGAIVTWTDYRGGAGDLYAQRISAAGAVQWAVNGAVMCNAVGDQFDVAAVPDLANGMYLAWADARGGTGTADIYAKRVTGAGATASGWNTTGSLVCNALNSQLRPALLADGAGCFVSWADERGGVGAPDIYAWRAAGTSSVGVGDEPSAVIGLAPPFPNPMRDGVTLRFEMSQPGAARLTVFDLGGRRVRSLVDDPALGAGFHTLQWDGRDAAGALAPAGLYLVQLETVAGIDHRKITLLR